MINLDSLKILSNAVKMKFVYPMRKVKLDIEEIIKFDLKNQMV